MNVSRFFLHNPCSTGVVEQGLWNRGFLGVFFAVLEMCFNTVVFPVGRSCGTGGVEQGVCSKKEYMVTHLSLPSCSHHMLSVGVCVFAFKKNLKNVLFL